jgi:hypothetical protein
VKILLAVFVLVNIARGASIGDVDFKNFAYPFFHRKYVSVPSRLRWMPHTGAILIAPQSGKYTFPCDIDLSGCPWLSVDQIDFGNIGGIPGTSAVVRTEYFTGGTAHWEYLYVIALRSGRPKVMAWLETGSRAYMGLRSFTIDHGDLVLIVNDPDKRMGDCCSTGTITHRYRWRDGSFHQIGEPILADDPQ